MRSPHGGYAILQYEFLPDSTVDGFYARTMVDMPHFGVRFLPSNVVNIYTAG
jgi:hypothetical protein